MQISIALLCTLATITTLSAAKVFGSDAEAPSNDHAVTRINLWEPGKAPGIVEGKDADVDPTEPYLDIYIPKTTPDDKLLTPVIVFPGGGYTHLSVIKEGKDVAELLEKNNFAAFVLHYRHAPRYHNPIPLDDAQRAIRLIRSRASALKINPDRLGIMGFSAGGHLAASCANAIDAPDAGAPDPIDRFSAHPNFAMLIYPVITFVEPDTHVGSRKALAGDDKELWTKLSAEKNVTSATCPIFMVHSNVDTSVPVINSILFAEACHANKVPVELHIFPEGKHGFGLAADNPVLNIWPSLALHWMQNLHLK